MSVNSVLQADRFQSMSDDQRKQHGIEPALRCPVHGEKLWPEKSGNALCCVVTRPTTCDYVVMVDDVLMATADV